MEKAQTTIEKIKKPSQNKRRTEARRKAFEEMRLNPGKIVPLPPPRRRRKKKKKNIVEASIVNKQEDVTPLEDKKDNLMEMSTSPQENSKISCQESFLAFLKKWLDDKNAEIKQEIKQED